MRQITAKLVVTPDNGVRGSEGRVYLQFPPICISVVGRTYKSVGNFKDDAAVMLIEMAGSPTVSPRAQYWWKNGVRDHGIRENWHVTLYELVENVLYVVVLGSKTGEPMPDNMPPQQHHLF